MISRDHHARSSRTAPNPRNHLGRPSDVALKNQHVMRTIWMAHNHPSGDPTPSRADEALTQTLKTALAMLDIRLLDHFIVTTMQVLSLAEQGLV